MQLFYFIFYKNKRIYFLAIENKFSVLKDVLTRKYLYPVIYYDCSHTACPTFKRSTSPENTIMFVIVLFLYFPDCFHIISVKVVHFL